MTKTFKYHLTMMIDNNFSRIFLSLCLSTCLFVTRSKGKIKSVQNVTFCFMFRRNACASLKIHSNNQGHLKVKATHQR